MGGLNQLDNFINCWMYYIDENLQSNGTYSEICRNAEFLAEQDVFEPYAFKWSMLSSGIFLSSIPGALLFPISDRYGRIPMMKLACMFSILGCVCQSVSVFLNSYALMLFGRLMIGVTNGASAMIYPIYLIEIASSDSQKRMFGASCQAGINLGTALSFLVGLEWLFGTAELWPYALVVQIIPNLLQFGLLFFSDESPVWLSKYDKLEHVESCGTDLESKTPSFWGNYLSQIKSVFSNKKLRNTLLICATFRFFESTNGATSFTMFSLRIFTTAGIDASVASVVSLSIITVTIFSAFFTFKIINYFGLRNTYLISAGGAFTGISTFFVMNFYVESSEVIAFLSLVPMTLWVVFAQVGLMSIPNMLPSLWLPIEFKQVCQAFMVLVGLVTNFPLNLMLPYLLYEIDNFTYLIFIVATASAFCFACFTMKK